MKTQEFLERIRMCNGLKNAIVTSISVDERANSVEFNLVTDKTYTASERETANEVAKSYFPPETKVGVNISKLVADEDILTRKILSIIKTNFPAVGSFVTADDVTVEKNPSGANFCIRIGVSEQNLFRTGNVLDKVAQMLSKCFCGSYIGNVQTVEREEQAFVPDSYIPPQEYVVPVRVFEVCKYKEIDGGEKPKYARYLADVAGEDDNLTVCGRIIDVQEKETKKGKTFFVYTITDTTSNFRVTYFTKKKSIDKIRELKVDDCIVCNGEYLSFNENLSYTAKTINYGSMPENFMPEDKPTKGVPAEYKTVFPEKFVDYSQADLFKDEKLPDYLKKNIFVVYDLETTGLNNTGLGGKVDEIIEIGAVKIVDGNVCEKFSSFVSPSGKLSDKIIELTGITDDMLVGAPDISKVIADFFKFCDGAIMAGHNSISFDSKFINYYAAKNDYAFNQKQMDTLTLSQKQLRLSNYKLNTIADYYGITFNHHRAFDDALATAKIFIELIKENGGVS